MPFSSAIRAPEARNDAIASSNGRSLAGATAAHLIRKNRVGPGGRALSRRCFGLWQQLQCLTPYSDAAFEVAGEPRDGRPDHGYSTQDSASFVARLVSE